MNSVEKRCVFQWIFVTKIDEPQVAEAGRINAYIYCQYWLFPSHLMFFVLLIHYSVCILSVTCLTEKSYAEIEKFLCIGG